MKTAAEFINSTSYNSLVEQKEAMIEFAKMHVQEALKQVVENIELDIDDFGSYIVDKKTIINAYPLDNIK